MSANVADLAVAEVFSTYAQPSPMSGIVLLGIVVAAVCVVAWLAAWGEK